MGNVLTDIRTFIEVFTLFFVEYFNPLIAIFNQVAG